jgi:serine/threonine protein kinase/Tol biopolymer transport system component
MSETFGINSTISHYRIVSKLGAGGMGEVYRARDARLDREVAIKVLPADFAKDADRLRRFEQEARATSALNHPNILTVFDIGNHEGSPYIVCELLEGQELRVRLDERAMAPRKAIEYAQQIVAGLSAAHERGITHRDLKPENLFITTDGRVKILDFGLAKLRPATVAAGAGSAVATAKALTDPGVVMGTVGYMSPEQVRGTETDHRSDIFSFGVILYEMLRGRRTFAGESAIEVMNAILKEEPEELTGTSTKISPALEKIVRRCLEKKPARRFQSTSDLGFALEALSTTSSDSNLTSAASAAVAETKKSVWRARLPWIVAGAFVLMAAALGFAYLKSSSASERAVRLTFEPPANLSFNDAQADAAVISPDGQKIAFTAMSPDGKYMLYVRDLNATEAQELPGSDLPLAPFWSPDSRSIAYGSLGKLKRSDLLGGNAQVLTDAPRLVAGAWNKSGDIIFTPDYGAAIFQIKAVGGEPKQVTFQEQAGDGIHSSGTFLPDGRRFLFNRGNASRDLSGLWMGSLDSKELKRILPEGPTVRFAPPDWLIMVRNQVLVAQQFDLSTLELIGDPMPIMTQTDNPARAPARFSVSNNGVLVWQGEWKREYQLLWLDRQGKQLGAIGQPAFVTRGQEPRLSPDGKRLALMRDGIWVTDLAGENGIRIGNGQLPTWSPDGRRIAYNGASEGQGVGILERSANGVGDPQLLLAGTVYPEVWTPDGRFLLYGMRGSQTRLDIWALPSFGERKPFPLLNSKADENTPLVSPNGRWIAYLSDESGYWELYVQSFTSEGKLGSDRQRISANGALSAVWSRDGQELFFISRDRQMMATTVKTDGAEFEFTPPVALFKTRTVYSYGLFREIAVTPDRQRFLVGTLIGEPKSANPTVILNWTSALKK